MLHFQYYTQRNTYVLGLIFFFNNRTRAIYWPTQWVLSINICSHTWVSFVHLWQCM